MCGLNRTVALARSWFLFIHSLLQLQIFEIFWRRKNSAGGGAELGGGRVFNAIVTFLYFGTPRRQHPIQHPRNKSKKIIKERRPTLKDAKPRQLDQMSPR